MRRSNEYYLALEAGLTALIGETKHLISQPNAAEDVQDLVRRSEYGVALTWLADLLVESEASVGSSARAQFYELAKTMGTLGEMPPGVLPDGWEAFRSQGH